MAHKPLLTKFDLYLEQENIENLKIEVELQHYQQQITTIIFFPNHEHHSNVINIKTDKKWDHLYKIIQQIYDIQYPSKLVLSIKVRDSFFGEYFCDNKVLNRSHYI